MWRLVSNQIHNHQWYPQYFSVAVTLKVGLGVLIESGLHSWFRRRHLGWKMPHCCWLTTPRQRKQWRHKCRGRHVLVNALKNCHHFWHWYGEVLYLLPGTATCYHTRMMHTPHHWYQTFPLSFLNFSQSQAALPWSISNKWLPQLLLTWAKYCIFPQPCSLKQFQSLVWNFPHGQIASKRNYTWMTEWIFYNRMCQSNLLIYGAISCL